MPFQQAAVYQSESGKNAYTFAIGVPIYRWFAEIA